MKGFDKKSVFVTIYLVGLLIVAFGYFFFGDASTYKISPELTTIEPEKTHRGFTARGWS